LTPLRQFLGRWEEEGLAQSRQGAKEEGNELRESTLCVFAPLREILLEPARVDLQTGTETFPANTPWTDFGQFEQPACRVREVLAESRRSARFGGPGPHQPRPNKPAHPTRYSILVTWLCRTHFVPLVVVSAAGRMA